MEGQFREVIRQKILDAIATSMVHTTRRDVRLPAVPNKAIAIIGMRRAGKTTLLWQVLAARLAEGMAREGLLYFSFEDERLIGMTAADLGIVVDEYFRLYPEWRDGKRPAFFFDEIQTIPGWESFARRLLDSESVELFLSGSSAKLLSRELASAMRGRAMEALVMPFSFREYLRHRGREPVGNASRLVKAHRSVLEKDLKDYLSEGGFPEAQGIAPIDRLDLLRGYVDIVLLRDVIERHSVTHPWALRWLSRQLLGNPGGSFSISKFHNDLKAQGIPVAKDTLHAYLAHLEDAFLFRTLSVATNSERRRMVNPRKVYPIDTGFISVFERAGRANTGHALETCVALELMRRGADIAYVRNDDGSEVDFLVNNLDEGRSLIQVCVELDSPDTIGREVRALLTAAEQYPDARLQVITMTPEVARDIPPQISVQSCVNWLLSTPGSVMPGKESRRKTKRTRKGSE